MRDPMRPETSIQGRQFPRDGTENRYTEEQVNLGDLCLSVGNLSDAAAYYKEALAETPTADAGARRDIILKVGDCLRRQGKHEDALCFLEDVMAGFDGSERRDLLTEKATLLCLLGRYGEAAELCDSIRAEEHTGERKLDARIYLVLGHVLLRVCKWKEAVKCFEQAATFARMCDDLTCLGNSLNNLGIAYKNLCRFDVSLRYLEKAVAAARREKNDASLAVRLLNLAHTAYKTGRITRARRAIAEAISITESLNLARLRLLGLITRARIEMLDGDYARARALIEEAIGKAETLEDPRASAVASETLGELLTLTGEFSRAKDVLEKCAEEAPSECRDVEAEVNSRIADLWLARGDRENAGLFAEAAMRIAKDIGDKFEYARSQRTAGLAAVDGERRSAALRRAERIFRSIGSLAEASITAHHLGRAKGTGSRAARRRAVKHLERALSGFESCSLPARMARVLCDLALVAMDQGQHEKALRYVERAEGLARGRGLDERLVEVRARVDASFSNALAKVPSEIPNSARDAYAMLSSCVGISGLVLAEVSEDRCARVVEAFGVKPADASYLAGKIAAGSSSTRFYSDVTSAWDDARAGGVGALLAVPVCGSGVAGVLIMTWDRAASGRPGTGAACIVRAKYESQQLLPVLQGALGRERENHIPICLGGIVSADNKMKEILFSLPKISKGRANILISGETGTGKELVARAIHALSDRANGPFVAQNCAALPEHLLESELFGHKSGAFTGAKSEKRGLLEVADGGIFFLDEVGEVSPVIQAKMLRAIEAGEIRRVGDTVPRTIDVRFVSATNKVLDEEVANGRMRRDLYYRLNVVAVSLPPLRDREADILLLAGLFLRRFSARLGKKVTCMEDDAARALLGYDWPGNVRQLENEIERAVTLAAPHEPVARRVLSAHIAGPGDGRRGSTLRDEVRTVEKRRILGALRQHGWNKTHAARALGDISRPALIAKMKRLGIPLKRGDHQQ